MDNKTSNSNGYAAREKKASWHAVSWVLVWALSITLSCAALLHLSFPKMLFGILAVFINGGIGLIAIIAYMRWLNALDEMLRKIWIESMAMTLGLLWIAFGSLQVLEAAEINYINAMDIGLLLLLAGLGMASGAIRALRYR